MVAPKARSRARLRSHGCVPGIRYRAHRKYARDLLIRPRFIRFGQLFLDSGEDLFNFLSSGSLRHGLPAGASDLDRYFARIVLGGRNFQNHIVAPRPGRNSHVKTNDMISLVIGFHFMMLGRNRLQRGGKYRVLQEQSMSGMTTLVAVHPRAAGQGPGSEKMRQTSGNTSVHLPSGVSRNSRRQFQADFPICPCLRSLVAV